MQRSKVVGASLISWDLHFIRCNRTPEAAMTTYNCTYYYSKLCQWLHFSLTTSSRQTIHVTKELIVTWHKNTKTVIPKVINVIIFFLYLWIPYFHLVFWSSDISSWYLSRAMWRLVGVSVASNTANTQLFRTEFGFSILTTCNDALNDDPPLSPPIFSQISLDGIRPSCQVNWPNLVTYMMWCELHVCVRLLLNLPLFFMKKVKNHWFYVSDKGEWCWS